MRYFCSRCGYSWIYESETCPICDGLREHPENNDNGVNHGNKN